MKSILGLALMGLAILGGTAATASAQATVTMTDIQRLQDRVYDAGGDISRVRARNADLASRLQSDLDELREEVVYLKVKLRKEGNVTRSEYTDVRDRIDQLTFRAREEGSYGGTASGGTTYPPSGSSYPRPGSGASGTGTTTDRTTGSTAGRGTYGTGQASSRELPVGTELDVRLQTSLNSGTAEVEQRFEATTAVDLRGESGEVLIPAGSLVRGVVSDVKRAGRVERKASMTLSFDQLTVRGRNYPIRATVAPFEGEGVRGDAAKIGTGAGVGAIIGGILGGFKGALAGILIGGGAVVAATEGQEVNLPAGTVLRIRFDSPVSLR
ncbi:MAG TPA: hypothetical protein VK886_22050 [Vicinamibacterales bacterium]|nr:hypothetical protein [Vicinamibacterales bacterium]